MYEQSAIKKLIEAQSGKSLYLQDLADRVTDAVYSQRMTLAQAAGTLKLGDRSVLQAWQLAVERWMRQIEF